MVLYGRINAANFTDKERLVIIRTRVPCEDGLLHADDYGTRILTVVNPLNDGVDRACEWIPAGAKWKSGYCKYIDVSFTARLAAGVNNPSLPYRFYGGSYTSVGDHRQFDITDDPYTIPSAFLPHDLYLQLAQQCTFELTVPLRKDNGGVLVTKQQFTLADGKWGQAYDQSTGVLSPNAVYTEAAQVIEPSYGNDNALVRVASRCYPEIQGGNKEQDHSFWQEMLFTLTNGTRFFDCWYWFGNSFATKDHSGQSWPPSLPRATDCSQEIAGDITLKIVGPKAVNLYTTYNIAGGVVHNDLGNGLWESILTLYSMANQPIWVNQGGAQFGDGVAHPPVRFSLFFDDFNGNYPLSAIEQDTLDAAELSQDGECWVTPVSDDWYAKQQCYGVFKSIPGYPGEAGTNIPANSSFGAATLANAKVQAHHWAHKLWRTFQLAQPTQEQEMGFAPSGGNPGGFPGFCCRYWPLARTSIPDLRGALVDSYAEANRCNKFKEELVTAVDPMNYTGSHIITIPQTGNPQRPGPFTDLSFWVGRPHLLAAGPEHKMGKLQPEQRHRAVKRTGADGGWWFPHDMAHWGIMEQMYATTLSGDPALKYFIMPVHRMNALASKAVRDGIYDADEFNGGYLQGRVTRDYCSRYGYTNSAWLYGGFSNRLEPRYVGPTSMIYDVTGDTVLMKKLLTRKASMYDRVTADRGDGFPVNLYGPEQDAPNTGFFWRVPRFGDPRTYDMAQHNTAEGPSGSLLHRRYCYVPWMGCMYIWHAWGWINMLRDTNLSDLDMTEINNHLRDSNMTVEEHADELEDYIYQMAVAYALHGFQKTNNTGNVWRPFYAVHWDWDPSRPGRALPESIKQQDVPEYSSINPATGLPYFMVGRGWHFVWTVGAIIIGWELALKRGDTAMQARFAELLDPSSGGYAVGDASSQWFGWGRGPNDNTVEYAAVIPDPFKDRSISGVSLGPTTIEGKTEFLFPDNDGDGEGDDDLGRDAGLPAATITGATTISGDPQGDHAEYALPAVTLAGGTTINEVVPSGGMPTLANEVLPPALVAGATEFLIADGDLQISSILSLPAVTLAGSTQFTRSLLVWAPIVRAERVFRLLASLRYYFNLKGIVGKMPAKYQTIEIQERNSVLLRVKVSFDTGYEGSLHDESIITWELGDKPDGNVYITKGLGSGIQVVNDDEIEITLDSEDTAEFNGTYYHELYLYDPTTGKVHTLMVGTVVVVPSYATK